MRLVKGTELLALVASFAKIDSKSTVLQRYRYLVRKVDREVNRLADLHRAHLQCGPGCDTCCQVERTVNLLEAYWIWRAIWEKQVALPEPVPERCALLVDGLCAAYEVRPILCRTHGLPLLYFHKGEVGVTYCHLNFRQLDAQGFDSSEVLDMTPINAELLSLDRDFCEQELGRRWNPQLRVALADLVVIRQQAFPDQTKERALP